MSLSPNASPLGKGMLVLHTVVSRASRAVCRCSVNIWRSEHFLDA